MSSSQQTQQAPEAHIKTSGWRKGLFTFGVVLIIATISVKLAGGISGFGGYTKTLEIEISNFKERELCGIRAGDGMKYKISRPVYVILASGTNSEVTSYIRINDTVPDEEFLVNKKGCVKLSFSYVKEFRDKTTTSAQMIPVTFFKHW